MNMRLLQGTLPETVEIDGAHYAVYTDFRRWIRLESILFEEEGDFLRKVPAILTLCYRELPPTLEDAVFGLVSFYEGAGGRQSGTGDMSRPAYSFIQDEDLIYAAFYQQYGIDLTKADLHWWQFRALLSGLAEQTQLSRIIGYRLVDVSSIKNPEERRFYRRMKALHKLTDTREESEREAAVCRALEAFF